MYKRIVNVLCFICDVLIAWGFGYFICVVGAPVGSAFIAGTIGVSSSSANIDLLIFLGVSYLCYAAFLVIAEVLLVRTIHKKLRSFVEKSFNSHEDKQKDGTKERKLFKKQSHKNLK